MTLKQLTCNGWGEAGGAVGLAEAWHKHRGNRHLFHQNLKFAEVEEKTYCQDKPPTSPALMSSVATT